MTPGPVIPSRADWTKAGLLAVLIPPVGLLCLWILARERRYALRSHGEATRRRDEAARAMLVARHGPGVLRSRPRPKWTHPVDYLS